MRATISFDIDLDKVEDTMAALVSQEAATLQVTANILENLGHGSVLHEVTEAVDLLQATASQLQQYKDMLVSFEQAKYNTVVPQSADAPINVPPSIPQSMGEMVHNMQELRDKLAKVNQFGEFVDRINNNPLPDEPESQPTGPETPDGARHEEG